MNQKTVIRVALLLFLFGVAAFIMRDKLGLISPRLARTVENITTSAPAAPSPTPAKLTKSGEPIAQEAPPQPQPPKKQLFPLKAEAKPLESVPAFPAVKPPVVYVGPLKGANDQQTTVADVFDQMLRYQLRAAPPDRLILNLVPYKHMTTLYHRSNEESKFKEQKPEKYVEDAARLDSDIAVCGRRDAAGNAEIYGSSHEQGRRVEFELAAALGNDNRSLDGSSARDGSICKGVRSRY